MIPDQLILFGQKLINYIVDATDTGTGNDKFDSTTLQKYEVPSGKRWLLLGGIVNRDVSSTLTITVKDATNYIYHLYTAGAGTGSVSYPNNDVGTTQIAVRGFPIILDAGEWVDIAFGTAQGAGAFATCVVLEWTL